MPTFNRSIYFGVVRETLFGGGMTQQQVDGQNFKLDAWEFAPLSEDLRRLSYCLATSYHETARTMWPIEEIGKGKGKPYGKPDPATGHAYYGRGDVQLTWADNYVEASHKLGLVGPDDLYLHPDRALDPTISAQVLYRGMEEGWFTGKKLSQYFSKTTDDPVHARAIVNNDVSKNGERIAGYHDSFYIALTKSLESDTLLPTVDIRTKGAVVVMVNGVVVG